MKRLPIILMFVCACSSFGQKSGSVEADSIVLKRKRNNVIKYDPLQLVFGEVPISWEHRMTKRSSFELTLGPTISGLFGNDRFWLKPFNYGSSIKMGWVAGFSTRFYLNKRTEELRKLYIAPAIRFRLLRNNRSDYVDETMLTVSLGYQHKVTRHLILDYYIGVGAEGVRHKGYNSGYLYYYSYQKARPPYGQFTGTAGVKMAIQTNPSEPKRVKTGQRDWRKNNRLKYDPLQLAFSEIPVSWERRIVDKLSIELTAGLTRTGIVTKRFWLRDPDSYGTSGKFGIVTGASVRFYLQENASALSKSYLSPSFRYRSLNDDHGNYTHEKIGLLIMGYQHRFPKGLLVDVYAGAGYELVKRKEYKGPDYVDPTLSFQSKYTNYGQFTAAAGVKLSVGPTPKELKGVKRKKKLLGVVESRRIAFKFQPDRSLFADYELGVEYRFSKKWSVEIESGFTRSHTAIERFYIEIPTGDYWFYSSSKVTGAIGYAGSLSFRYYFREKASQLAQWYIAPRIKFRRYNEHYYYRNYDYQNNVSYPVEEDGFLNETMVSFNIGNQFWFLKHFGMDVYAGLNFGHFYGEYHAIGEKPPGFNGFYKHSFSALTLEKMLVFPTVGIKFSVGF